MTSPHPPINKLTVTEPTKVKIDEKNLMSREDLQKCFDKLETALNDTKNKLDPLFELPRGSSDANSWMQVQKLVDMYKGLRNVVTQQYNGKHVSNSWLKYYEIFSQFKLFEKGRKYKCFFNAELPGGSLCALMHYMKVYDIKYEWKASSLVGPSSTGGTDEPLGDTYGLYEKYPDHWVMDPDGKPNNGDMTDKSCIENLEKKLGRSMDFYSSDAGTDVSYRNGKLSFNDQELHNLRLHIGCGLAGLLLLVPGGSMVLKQYTMFKPLSWWALLQYAKCFEKCYFYKPLTSRPYNSEMYFVCEGFKGVTSEIRESLFAAMDMAGSEKLPKNIPTEVPRAICLFARIVYERQIRFINENIWLMNSFARKNKMNVIRAALKTPSHDAIDHWIEKIVDRI